MTVDSKSQRTDYRLNVEALAAFRYELRRFLAFSEELVRTAGLEPQQHQLMLAIKGLPHGLTATIGTVASRLHIRHHTVVELVDRLEAKHLVIRTRSGHDRRRVVVSLTPTGERQLKALVQPTLIILERTGPELIQALERVVNHVNTARATRTRRGSS